MRSRIPTTGSHRITSARGVHDQWFGATKSGNIRRREGGDVEAFTRISNEDIDLKKGRGVRLANLIVQESRHDSMFSRNELRLQLFLVAFMLLYYGALLTNGSFNFLQRGLFGLTFNSMLEHLLHGHFNVDPEAVGNEGFLRDGRVYAYWGIFCAVVRLPLLTFKAA